MVEYPIQSDVDNGAWLEPDNIANFAQTLEELGIDAIAFTDHPAPSKKWLDAGGHETFDPFVGLGFCAAVTSSIRLMTHLAVVPYRNPFLLAKSMTSVDVLARGRTTFVLGTGYLRSEFSALGVEMNERNELFDESIEVMKRLWSSDSFSFSGRHFKAFGQSAMPRPVQRPHPPLWLGGNSKVVLDRLARWGDGWAALVGTAQLAQTSRTPSITGPATLKPFLSEIADRLEHHNRSMSDIEIMCSSPAAVVDTAMTTEERIELIGELAELGVSWIQLVAPIGSYDASIDAIRHFAQEVAAHVR